MKIDIFGDGKNIHEANELPDEIVNSDGRYIKDNSGIGISYSLIQPSVAYLTILDDMNKKDKELMEKKADSVKSIQDLTTRIEALEKK